MTKNKKNNWLSEKEAATIIGLPTKFLRKLVIAGSLKGVVNYINSKRSKYLYNKVELENYMFEDYFLAGL